LHLRSPLLKAPASRNSLSCYELSRFGRYFAVVRQRSNPYASAEGRLPEGLYLGDCDASIGEMRVRSVHEVGYGRNFDWERRNRSWPEALKREIVEASFAAGSSVSVVARRYDVNANQAFGWRIRRDFPFRPDSQGAALVQLTAYRHMRRMPGQKRPLKQTSAFPDREIIAKAEGRFAKANKERASIKGDPKEAVTRARARVRGFNR
jgi:transposase-like protein